MVCRALVRSLAEMLFLCGSNKRAAIASLSILEFEIKGPNNIPKDEVNIMRTDFIFRTKFIRVNRSSPYKLK